MNEAILWKINSRLNMENYVELERKMWSKYIGQEQIIKSISF